MYCEVKNAMHAFFYVQVYYYVCMFSNLDQSLYPIVAECCNHVTLSVLIDMNTEILISTRRVLVLPLCIHSTWHCFNDKIWKYMYVHVMSQHSCCYWNWFCFAFVSGIIFSGGKRVRVNVKEQIMDGAYDNCNFPKSRRGAKKKPIHNFSIDITLCIILWLINRHCKSLLIIMPSLLSRCKHPWHHLKVYNIVVTSRDPLPHPMDTTTLLLGLVAKLLLLLLLIIIISVVKAVHSSKRLLKHLCTCTCRWCFTVRNLTYSPIILSIWSVHCV